MSDAPAPRGGRLGGIFVAVVVGGSAIGVVGWYLLTNRSGSMLDSRGFDLETAPQSARPTAAPSASASAPAGPRSSLDMMKADAGIRIVDSNSSSSSGSSGSAGSSAAGTPEQKKQASREGFTQTARKHEGDVLRFSQRMTAKYPIIRQYGRDWMSHPDLRKLNDDYMRNHDPIAFMVGLSRAPSLGPMLKQYAGRPEIREFIVQGMKQAPSELTGSAMEVLQNDRVMKDLVVNVTSGLGLPPSITGMIASAAGGADPGKIDQNKVMKDVMSSPDVQKAMQQQPSPVPLGR